MDANPTSNTLSIEPEDVLGVWILSRKRCRGK